jgi:hypothetical protein
MLRFPLLFSKKGQRESSARSQLRTEETIVLSFFVSFFVMTMQTVMALDDLRNVNMNLWHNKRKYDLARALPNSWMYSLGTHSLRKFFRTQMSTTKIDTEIILYMTGHTIDTYEDVQSLGVGKLRQLYMAAGLAIRTKTKINRIEQLKEIIHAWGENPEQILSKDALARGNITETTEQTNNHQLSVLAQELKQIIRKEVTQ